MKKLISPLILAGLVGCANAPLTNQIEAASTAVQDLAVQIDRLQKSGAITNQQEDEYLDRLKEANGALRQANALAAGCKSDCTDATNLLLAANQLLIQLQSEVKK